MKHTITSYIKDHKRETILLAIILVAAAFFRLYKVDQYMRFLGDEGRDALVVLEMVHFKDIPLIGPGTSVGNMYMGPLYYYMMFFPMLLTNGNPISAAVMVALIGTASVGLLYYVGKRFFGEVAGFAAATLYAVAYIPVSATKSSWNPYPLPFFSLLVIVSLYNAIVDRKPHWLIITGVALAFALQMHPLAMILLPIVSILWIMGLAWTKKTDQSLKSYIIATGIGLLVFGSLMSPLVLFDLNHQFMNFNAFKSFFLNRETSVNLNPFNTLGKVWEIYQDLYASRLITYGYATVGIIISVILALFAIIEVGVLFLQKKFSFGFFVLILWLVVGLVGISLVKTHVYDHYLGYLSPAIYLLFGLLITQIWAIGKYFRPVALLIVAYFVILNILHTPLLDQPGNQIYRTQNIAKYIISQVGDQPYNFALISKSNYDAAYRYYFTYWNRPVTVIDPQNYDATRTNQLWVVCEDNPCDPLHAPQFEVAAYGWADIVGQTQVDGTAIYKLQKKDTP